jgi:rRNA maturation protein Nop10
VTTLPVTCKACGTSAFVPAPIRIDNSRNATFKNVVIGGACPRCGGDVRVHDGSYDFAGGVMTAFRRLDETALKEVRDLLRDQQTRDIDQAELAAQLSAVSEELGAIAGRMAQSHWTTPTIVGVLLAALQVVLAWMALHQTHDLTSADHEVLRRDIQHAIEHVVPETPRSDKRPDRPPDAILDFGIPPDGGGAGIGEPVRQPNRAARRAAKRRKSQ